MQRHFIYLYINRAALCGSSLRSSITSNYTNYIRSTMQEILKYIAFGLFSVALASPIDGIQRRDTFVWGSLGDSWASGVSFDGKNTDYDNNTNGCLRWKNSYGPLMEADTTWTTNPQTFHFAACSGAFLDHIELNPQDTKPEMNPPQMDQVGNPMMLTYQAGGNNCGFGEAVSKCLYPFPGLLGYDKPYPDPNGACFQAVNKSNTYINNMRTNDDDSEEPHGLYLDEFRTIQAVLLKDAVKNNPDFKLYVLGYAHFFNLGTNYCDNLSFAPGVKADPNGLGEIAGSSAEALGLLETNYHPPNVTNQLRTDFNDATTRVNNVIRKAVNDVNDPRVKFIDVSPAFNGHRFCENSHSALDQWFNTDVWLWNLNFPSQDPPANPPSLSEAFIINGTMPGSFGIASINGTVGIESGSVGGIPWAMRPFHPKIGGTSAIAEYIKAAAKADKIPGVVGSNSSPCQSATLVDCVYQWNDVPSGQPCPTNPAPPLPATCTGPLPFAATPAPVTSGMDNPPRITLSLPHTSFTGPPLPSSSTILR